LVKEERPGKPQPQKRLLRRKEKKPQSRRTSPAGRPNSEEKEFKEGPTQSAKNPTKESEREITTTAGTALSSEEKP